MTDSQARQRANQEAEDLIAFGRFVIECMEKDECWSLETLAAIETEASSLGLASVNDRNQFKSLIGNTEDTPFNRAAAHLLTYNDRIEPDELHGVLLEYGVYDSIQDRMIEYLLAGGMTEDQLGL